jgi:hypothetical protein
MQMQKMIDSLMLLMDANLPFFGGRAALGYTPL